jgi:PAS domain S-box-containing protein
MRINYKVFFDLCFQHSDNLILILSEDLEIREMNSRAETYLGFKKQDVLGKKINLVLKQSRIQSFINSNEILKKESTTSYIDYYGHTLQVFWEIIPVHDDEFNDAILVMGRIEMPNTDNGLEDLQLDNILNYAPGLFYWKDKNSVYHGCNDEFARLAGLDSRAQVKGKTDHDLAWKDRAELYTDVDQKVIESGIPTLNHEEVVKMIDGKPMTAITNKVPLWNPRGEVVGLLGITIDITRQKEVEHALKIAKEQAEAANRAKIEFISNMSHDIRTPLTGVVGMSKMLEDSVTDPNQKQYAHWLGESGDQLLKMLNSILDVVSSDNANEDNLHEESFDIKRMIQDIVELERPSILVKGIDLITHVDERIPAFLCTDHIKLHRILLNLLGNAIKFTEKGYVEIRIILLTREGENVTIQFQVRDTGIGISDELQKKVFEQFFRALPSYEGVYTGHGVGLHIAQSYAKLLATEIKIKSKLNVGTTFYFDLPLKFGKEVQERDDTHVPILQEKTSKGSLPKVVKTTALPDRLAQPSHAPHALLVEDNKIALLMLENLVTQAGYRFTSATDGEMALTLAKTHAFDFVITDLGLPKLSGIEFTRALRALESHHHNQSIPVFGLTAHADVKIKAECLEAGMNKAFTKPMTPAMLESIKINYFSLLPSSVADTHHADPTVGSLGLDLPNTEAELFELEALPLLNIDHALNGIGNDMALLKSILSAMVEQELPQDLDELYLLHAKSDWETVEHLAHRMKGGLMYCGTERLVFACQYLERYRKAGHSKMLEPLYQQVCLIADKTMTAIKSWLRAQVNQETSLS